MRKFSSFFFALWFLSELAFARALYYQRTYNVELHFGNWYYDSKVVAVTAHVGVEKGVLWTNVVDVKLEPAEAAFVGKLKIEDVFSNFDPVPELAVSYHLEFSDGTDTWTPVYKIPSRSHGLFFEGCTMATRTCFGSFARGIIKDLNDKFETVVPDKTKANFWSVYH